MNSETASPFPTSTDTGSSSTGLNGSNADSVHRLAQRVHDTVDMLEQKFGQGSEKVMGMHQEYSDMAREQVRANPLAAVGIAFATGYIFAKLFGR